MNDGTCTVESEAVDVVEWTEVEHLPESAAETGAGEAQPNAHLAHHDAHLAHHFENPSQQFSAAKLGMWLFLATELLLFGGLFCLYAVFRNDKPEIFHYGAQFLDVRLGALNTVILILSSLTMAAAVTAAQRSRRRALCFLLTLTLLGGAGFMIVKFIEYQHKFHERLVWGAEFYSLPHTQHGAAEETDEISPAAEPAIFVADVHVGQGFWDATCRSCHGAAGEGMQGQGKDIRGSAFIESQTDAQLLAFIKAGRMSFDPENTTGLQMPPKGGNPTLKDDQLRHIIGYVRTFKAPGTEPEAQLADADAISDADKEEFWIPKSSVPPAPAGPSGVNHVELIAMETGIPITKPPRSKVPHALDPDRPHDAHLFFSVYFLMTGLHGLHVLIGMGAIAWILMRSMLGHFSAAYFTPVDITGLYWHVVDLIWIFLFPLLYLIG